MNVAILKYNAGNTRSVALAFNRLGIQPIISDEPRVLRSAAKVVIPGVGAAAPAMRYLRERELDKVIAALVQPVLGICVGLQLFCESSEEGEIEKQIDREADREIKCLGIFPVKVERFTNVDKVPHMGWNSLENCSGPLFTNLPAKSHAYFLHSYRAPESSLTNATCQYGERFSAGLQRDNFYAVQFHPERSGVVGAKILQNFLEL
mgnify:CR=1 FL=1